MTTVHASTVRLAREESSCQQGIGAICHSSERGILMGTITCLWRPSGALEVSFAKKLVLGLRMNHDLQQQHQARDDHLLAHHCASSEHSACDVCCTRQRTHSGGVPQIDLPHAKCSDFRTSFHREALLGTCPAL